MAEQRSERQGEGLKTSSFDSFPWWMVVTCNATGLAIYAIGLYVMAGLGSVWGLLYLAYCVWMEGRLLWGSCRHCYFFGKRCGFGKGRLCAGFFTRGAERSPGARTISWRDVVPDFMVWLIPLGGGIALLIRDFWWLVLLLIVALVFLGSVGTAFVRGQLACKYCKQRELGCPAEQLFSNKKHA
jgi:hypothetical protein